MLARLALLFVIVPLAELTLLMMLADWTNWKVAVACVLITGVAGAWLVQHQGWRTVRRIREELGQGHMPGDALLDGLLILAAGLLLLTPGILTDLMAIVILIPVSRQYVKSYLVRWFRSRFTIVSASGARPIIDTTARRVDDE